MSQSHVTLLQDAAHKAPIGCLRQIQSAQLPRSIQNLCIHSERDCPVLNSLQHTRSHEKKKPPEHEEITSKCWNLICRPDLSMMLAQSDASAGGMGTKVLLGNCILSETKGAIVEAQPRMLKISQYVHEMVKRMSSSVALAQCSCHAASHRRACFT